ncbi:MAG: Rieske 2Fe-2S domain-containing protein [Proteobacteria bacterium]|nr:Rieske 2Fe-2S domain-containing protein [Pseudomonadota bacterium]
MAAAERLICRAESLADGGDGERFTVAHHGVSESAFAVRFGGKVYAYLNRCGHMPVELDWQPGRFFDDSGLYLICATHGAIYSPESGRCLGGRCNGTGLAPLAIVERDGNVYLEE